MCIKHQVNQQIEQMSKKAQICKCLLTKLVLDNSAMFLNIKKTHTQIPLNTFLIIFIF